MAEPEKQEDLEYKLGLDRVLEERQEIAASDFLEPRTTDQSNLPDVISDPSKDPNKSPKSKGSLFRGIGKLAQSRIFPLIQMAQGAYGALSEEQKSEISNFLDKPAYELVGMEKPGLEYFKDLLLAEKPSTEVSETPAENLMKFSPRTTELSKEALSAFKNVSDTQRGRPELAMVKLQMEGSANELNGVVEHIGDLTHVLTNEAPYGSFRRDRVLGKIAGQINTLDKPDDVINNFLEQNYRSEAEFSKRDVNEVKEISERLLKQYAEEHKKVPVYNRPQFFAREAAVAVGEKRYSDAVDYLKKLRSIAEDPVAFQQAASTFIKPKLAEVPAENLMKTRPVIKEPEVFFKGDLGKLQAADSPDGMKAILFDDEDYSKELLGELRTGDTLNPASLKQLNTLKKKVYDQTQESIAELPDVLSVYRIGKLGRNEASEPVSFSLTPNIPLSGLPWYKDKGLSIQEYKVNKSDILAAPNAIFRKGKGSADEQEVIIRGTDVVKVSPDD
tara:strand:- start:14 stop:1519 length:1506 start_codon:yes stop_codon:yes gene_type:complete